MLTVEWNWQGESSRSVAINRCMGVLSLNKQERPPAWTQEAYRPPYIKYSICCPILGGGTPSLTGVPHLWLGRGYLIPHPWPGYSPILTWLGYPHLDLAKVPLVRTWDQWKYYGMEMGYPPGCELTNGLKILPPPSFGLRAVTIKQRSSSSFRAGWPRSSGERSEGFSF